MVEVQDGQAEGRAIAAAVAAELATLAEPARAAREKAYLKSDLEVLGCGVPALRKVVTAEYRRHPELRHQEIVTLIETLWAAPVHERRLAAVELLVLYLPRLEAADIALIERLLRESKTWALVDELSGRVAGGLVDRFPELGEVLDRWAVDPDFWLRRSALLAMLGPIRRGEAGFERFAVYADGMLQEREFFIRKAIGWVLRETGKRRPEQVFAWLAPRTDRASGITVREAIKYLPKPRAEALLEAYLERRPLI